jgi:hypothetical protein
MYSSSSAASQSNMEFYKSPDFAMLLIAFPHLQATFELLIHQGDRKNTQTKPL